MIDILPAAPFGTTDQMSPVHAADPDAVHRRVVAVSDSGTHKNLWLALREMREVGGRDATTGEGKNNSKWSAPCLGMVILDGIAKRWSGYDERPGDVAPLVWLLTHHGVEQQDAAILCAIRNALLHDFGFPDPKNERDNKYIGGGSITYSDDDAPGTFALWSDATSAVLSLPVFCSVLVESFAADLELAAELPGMIQVAVMRPRQ